MNIELHVKVFTMIKDQDFFATKGVIIAYDLELNLSKPRSEFSQSGLNSWLGPVQDLIESNQVCVDLAVKQINKLHDLQIILSKLCYLIIVSRFFQGII